MGLAFSPQPLQPAQIFWCTQMHQGHGDSELGVNRPINGIRVAWLATWSSVNIGKELLPIVLAAATWGSLWSGQAVRFHCDNAAIVHTISSGKSTESLVMQLLRGLHLFAMEHAFPLTAAHIAGMENGAADALSRNQAHLFFTQVPQAAPAPDTLPESLLLLFLAETAPDWLSESWRQQLTSILA